VAPAIPRGGREAPVTADPPILLLTRPAPQARRFADSAAQRFGDRIRIVSAPLMAAEFLAPDLSFDGIAGLVFTSETGVAGLARLTKRRDLPAHCVGAATARAARAAGFPVATTASGDAQALVQALRGQNGPLLWARGVDAAADLVALLAAQGIAAQAALVYRQAAQPPTGAALAALAGDAPVILPLFSPRSARLAAQALPRGEAPILVAAISEAVAEAAAQLAPERIEIAARPDAARMLDAVSALIDAAQRA